jgi:beta-glucosidase
LFAFGFGLSYTTFDFSPPRLAKTRIRRHGSTRLSVDVTNTGTREGAEIVQLYIRDLVSSVTRPVKELRGFQRVVLQPGETRTVVFEITPELLAFWDVHMRFTVEAGEFELMTGKSSRDCDLQKVTLLVN